MSNDQPARASRPKRRHISAQFRVTSNYPRNISEIWRRAIAQNGYFVTCRTESAARSLRGVLYNYRTTALEERPDLRESYSYFTLHIRRSEDCDMTGQHFDTTEFPYVLVLQNFLPVLEDAFNMSQICEQRGVRIRSLEPADPFADYREEGITSSPELD